MKRKDFYIGLLVITISLHILGFTLSDYGDFTSYLSQDPIVSFTFYIEVTILTIIFMEILFREIAAMVKYDSDKN